MKLTEAQFRNIVKRLVKEQVEDIDPRDMMDKDLASDMKEPGMTMADFQDLQAQTAATVQSARAIQIAKLLDAVTAEYNKLLAKLGDEDLALDGIKDSTINRIGRMFSSKRPHSLTNRVLVNGLVKRGISLDVAENIIDAGYNTAY